MAAIGRELDERESSLRQQLHSHQATSAEEISQLTADVARLTHELDLTNAQVSLSFIVCLTFEHMYCSKLFM